MGTENSFKDHPRPDPEALLKEVQREETKRGRLKIFLGYAPGVAIKPFPNHKFLSKWLFRPEIRYDHSDKPVFNNGDRNNWTCSVDALFTF